MIFVRDTVSGYRLGTINLRCPACSHKGAFASLGHDIVDAVWNELDTNGNKTYSNIRAGLRHCPNEKCSALVFFVDHDGDMTVYPPEVIDFDSSNLPPRILASLEESIKAHAAGCFRASALMVRRVLEELCEDKQAKGNNLMLRLQALSSTVIIPKELLDAADELRLLGNDAAHIEAKTYDNIGAQECEIAIELTKELLKAVYQYTSLVSKLRALKKS
ncbi:DUF4145 domain-containing protein [Brucella sp. 10RB9214]|uniref:DUF4145 domain-containing protein n=1 Tax=unclassified Brucella TaxID=2632610 RepID=UPI000972AFD3|nr:MULTISPECIES: DUF4145 domain-containing protein [unclassified Brucella]APY16207.1 hypothetical protein BKD02_16370 [Brucella sp. 09RB8910]MRN48089.1 DUF4145 domain-containing protein [Brucella sp. 10RB9212]MRN50763.1 DUF4145 domain-containing protein [Brucella sp. 10RB9214]